MQRRCEQRDDVLCVTLVRDKSSAAASCFGCGGGKLIVFGRRVVDEASSPDGLAGRCWGCFFKKRKAQPKPSSFLLVFCLSTWLALGALSCVQLDLERRGACSSVSAAGPLRTVQATQP